MFKAGQVLRIRETWQARVSNPEVFDCIRIAILGIAADEYIVITLRTSKDSASWSKRWFVEQTGLNHDAWEADPEWPS